MLLAKSKINHVLLLGLFLTAGFLSGLLRLEEPPGIQVPGDEVSINGTVTDVPEISGEKSRFTIDEVIIDGKAVKGKIRLNIMSEYFGGSVSKTHLFPGARVSAVAKVDRPRMFRNPGVYAYDSRKDGIAAAGYVRHMLITGSKTGPLFWISEKRWMLARIIDNSLPAESAAFIKALLPGLKMGITDGMRDAFSATGLSHLLSISGTHFGLLAFVIFTTARSAFRCLPLSILVRMTMYVTPSQAAMVLALPVLIFYALISGMSIPAVRSLVMVLIFMAAQFLGRKGRWLNSLAVASIIILICQPGALFEISFQLSFLAVLSIGYVMERRTPGSEDRIQNRHHRSNAKKTGELMYEKFKTTVMITVAAVAGTAPVVAMVFKQFPLLSPLTNLIITPLVCFIILPLAFMTGFIALLFNAHSMPLSGLTEAAVRLSFGMIKAFSTVPFAAVRVPAPSFIIILIYYVSLVLALKSAFRWRFVPLVMVLCLYLAAPHLTAGKLRVAFLDAGQGDAAVVELPDGKVMLVDGSTMEPDAGRGVVAPYLWAKGIRKIDYMVISHPHPDHYGGLMYIMDNFEIREIWSNGRVIPDAGALYRKIGEKKIPVKVLKRGDVMEEDHYRIYVFHPYDEFYADSPRGGYSSENNDSLVFKIDDGNISVLFTGDIEKEAEENLLSLGQWLDSDIIKVPHHGARQSSSEAFIDHVSPGTAVISAGRRNPFGHPHAGTLKRYRHAGAGTLRTDVQGAITITSKDRSPDIRTYEDSRFRAVSGWRDEVRNLKLLL